MMQNGIATCGQVGREKHCSEVKFVGGTAQTKKVMGLSLLLRSSHN